MMDEHLRPLASGWSFNIWISALSAVRRNRSRTASPNAGWTMSAMSGILHVRLEKVGHYAISEEYDAPTPKHIELAVSISRYVAFIGVVAIVGLIYVRGLLW